VGGGDDERVRREARLALAAVTLGEIHATTLIDDGVSESLARSRDRTHDADLHAWTVRRVRDVLLAPGGEAWAARYGAALGSEAIAAVVKVMTRDQLSAVARGIGRAPHFGSRIQPNSPGDDEREILFSIFEGLAHGCGDVVIGLNPAADDVDTIVRLEQLLEQVVRRLELPTRFCVLSDLVKQHAALQRTRVDVGFQSLAGTSRALAGMVGLDVDGVADLARAFGGLYFETGQGSEVTNGAAEGVDMGTLESRTYGVARAIRQTVPVWTIVNDVAGFIGPEVFSSADQLERVCLEDVVMARLHGLTMGLDVCATFHMGITPSALRQLTQRIVERAAPAYLMAVAGNADPMLGYLTTSFREHPALRRIAGRTTAGAMRGRLAALGVPDAEAAPTTDVIAGLSARYARAGGDRRSTAALEAEARRELGALQESGWDLGLADTARAEARVDASTSTRARPSMPSSTTPWFAMPPPARCASARRRSAGRSTCRLPLRGSGCERGRPRRRDALHGAPSAGAARGLGRPQRQRDQRAAARRPARRAAVAGGCRTSCRASTTSSSATGGSAPATTSADARWPTSSCISSASVPGPV
jgi:ethanolamine ammonia-lyase large subunit